MTRPILQQSSSKSAYRAKARPVVSMGLFALGLALWIPGCAKEGGTKAPSGHGWAPPVSAPIQVDVRHFYESSDETKMPEVAGQRPNVLLITLDTVRRDRLSCYGYARGTTPNLDALAASSYVFDNCYATAPVTLPSHASILTGLEPPLHGVRNNGIHSLAPEFETLAEALSRRGYATGAVIGAFPLDHRFGLDQGFASYDDDLAPTSVGSPIPQRSAEEVTRRGLEWIRQNREEDWFAWLHYFDPHDPYFPPSPFRETFADDLYDGELAYLDSHLGGLFRELQRLGVWSNTLIVVTSDHGEGLGDHGEETHSLFLYEPTIAAPLLLKLPGHAPKARLPRISALTSSVDIFPTVLEIAIGDPGTPTLSGHGRSLVPVLADGNEVRTWAYMETLVPELDYGWSPYHALRHEDWKMIRGAGAELFDLERDAQELVDRSQEHEELVLALQDTLIHHLKDDRRASTLAMDEQTIAKLRSLGYVAGGGSESSGPRPDTKEMLWALDLFDEARAKLETKQIESAGQTIEQVLARDPKNRFARRMQSWLLLEEGRPAEAETMTRQILVEETDAADRSTLATRLAQSLLQQGDIAEAEGMNDKILTATPDLAEAWILEIRIAGRQGDFTRAEAAAARAAELSPGSFAPVRALGRVYERAERWDDAAAVYEKGIREVGPFADLLAGLASMRLRQGQADLALPVAQQILRADPLHPRANFLIGTIHLLAGKAMEATPYLVRAVTGEPANPVFQARLGSHCLAGQNYSKAALHLERAIELGLDDAQTRASLGFAQAELGETDRARQSLEAALRHGPEPELARRIRARLAEVTRS